MDFQAGEVLLVDKPLDWTSFQAVGKLRWAIRRKLGIKKIKVGHAGTLDPRATGLLIICTGKKTKEINQYMATSKVYTGTIKLGCTTPSFDTETEEENHVQVPFFTLEQLQQVANEFTGDLMQTPPIFSAVKVDGKRAYESARKGEQVEIKAKPIHISYFKVLKYENNEVYFEVEVSKGTYIRSLANDFGAKLKVGGYLKTLRRESSGEFKVSEALSVDDWVKKIEES